ncbi:uncharacterized protein H6S33_001983 [Morchella sextelata]|uniref:uncharacterized protein n=1 Tax=Morchella sextelata TaxID=1174677 RepID=UPI001D041A88|nr:uncharacterized protein H6S33_001983 [Morchella sextelata]KAH0607931.1 hypothetical protein H6S33_001983 [Morchella sextelata]
MQIHPELVIRTRKGFPFLIYNCPGTIYTLRQNFTNTHAGADIEWLLKQTVVNLDFELDVVDPYNVAAALAIAQEQHSWFCRSNLTSPKILKVHLITPHPTLAAVYFYTVEVPLWYLEALMDPYLKVAGKVQILKEFVELPVPPASGQAVITTGPFLEKIGEILGEMRALNSV